MTGLRDLKLEAKVKELGSRGKPLGEEALTREREGFLRGFRGSCQILWGGRWRACKWNGILSVAQDDRFPEVLHIIWNETLPLITKYINTCFCLKSTLAS